MRGQGVHRRAGLWFVLVLGVALIAGAAFAQEDGSLGGNERWWDGFVPYGALGALERSSGNDILAGVVHEGSLILAGEFRYLNGIPVPGIARWTGETWEAVDATGLPWDVWQLADYDGVLVAGGEYAEENPEAESCLYRQTETGWEPFGPDTLRMAGMGIARLKVAGDNLYALAMRPFPCCGVYFSDMEYVIARWNGTDWELIDAAGDLKRRGNNFGILFDVDEFRGDPIVAGSFRFEDGDTTGNVARWTGSELEPLDAGTHGTVNRLSVYENRLVVSGYFDEAGGLDTGPVAAWDGQSWSPLGERLSTGEPIRANIRYMEVSNGKLLAWGYIDRVGSVPTGHVVTWDGTAWTPTSVDSADDVHLVPGFLIETEDGLLFGGSFRNGSHSSSGLARLEGSRWAPYPARGIRLSAYPTCALATDEGLVVAGEFTLPGRIATTKGLARWSGDGWEILARSLDEGIYALTEFRGQLIAGGSFSAIDGVDANHIASLHDGRWRQIGNGFNESVFALEVFDGKLIAAGRFTQTGSRTANRVAAWDGLSWQPLGLGIQGNEDHLVRDLEIYGGDLYACGRFNWAEGSWVDNVARWDGKSWSRVGPVDVFEGSWWYSPWLFQLASWNGRLVAVGDFEGVQDQEASSLAAWDGEIWTPVTPLLDGEPDEVAVYQGRLIVGGRITRQGEDCVETGLLLAHDGDRWLTLGSGVSLGRPDFAGFITDIAEWRKDLFVLGEFFLAGGRFSMRIARWDGSGLAPPPVDRLRAAPNPTIDQSTLTFRLDGPGQTAVRVFDIQGRRVATLHDGFMTGGEHTAVWDLRDATGRRVPAGVYFLRVDSPFSRATEKVVVIR